MYSFSVPETRIYFIRREEGKRGSSTATGGGSVDVNAFSLSQMATVAVMA